MKLDWLLAALPLSLRKASGFPDGGFKTLRLGLYGGIAAKFLNSGGKPEAFRKGCGKAALAMLKSL